MRRPFKDFLACNRGVPAIGYPRSPDRLALHQPLRVVLKRKATNDFPGHQDGRNRSTRSPSLLDRGSRVVALAEVLTNISTKHGSVLEGLDWTCSTTTFRLRNYCGNLSQHDWILHESVLAERIHYFTCDKLTLVCKEIQRQVLASLGRCDLRETRQTEISLAPG